LEIAAHQHPYVVPGVATLAFSAELQTSGLI